MPKFQSGNLRYFTKFKKLEFLRLAGTQITDQGLLPLMKLPLGHLRLHATLATYAVIPVLKNCATLHNVPVGGTRMTLRVRNWGAG